MNKTYESASLKLEEIIQKIESGEISIDELSDYVNEAKELITFCKTKLTKTEEEIEKIIKTMD